MCLDRVCADTRCGPFVVAEGEERDAQWRHLDLDWRIRDHFAIDAQEPPRRVGVRRDT